MMAPNEGRSSCIARGVEVSEVFHYAAGRHMETLLQVR